MLALTVRQPWASLILLGVKPVENRSWRPRSETLPIGDRFWIHAGKAFDKTPNAVANALPVEACPTGALLGTVRLVGIHRAGECGPECLRFGEADVWHWMLADPEPLEIPIPMNGRLQLWPVTR